MNLVTARCPDCGADLKIPEGSQSVTCEYCGSQVLVADILGTSAVMQNCMTLAYAALEKEDYNDAYGHFNSALEIDMKNYSAWFGKAICTGRTGKLIDMRIDEEIKLFETAFGYAPADKQQNMRRNASVEIVKAIKGLMQVFKLQQEMLSFEEDDADMKKGLEDASNKVKQEFTGALDKAREYDPSNADIDPMKKEITEASTPAQMQPDYTRPAIEHMPPPVHVDVQQPAPPVTESKKSGCAMMMVMMMMVVVLCAGVLFNL
jgi:tetratricopeptide (TPR) repeat protein